MIVTVTLNPAVDKTLIVPDFGPGKINRGTVERLDPGGKSNNVAKALRERGRGVRAPKIQARCTVGHAMAGVFAQALAAGMTFADALRPATAAGAAVAASSGSSVASRSAIEALLPQVELADLGEEIPL